MRTQPDYAWQTGFLALVLDKTRRPPERFDIMPVLPGLFLFKFLFRLGQVCGIPIGTVLMDGGFKLADVFRRRF